MLNEDKWKEKRCPYCNNSTVYEVSNEVDGEYFTRYMECYRCEGTWENLYELKYNGKEVEEENWFDPLEYGKELRSEPIKEKT